MRKLKLQVQMSVDGYIAGENGELNWATMEWSDDLKNYVDEITRPVDTILLGRNLAEGFIPYWAGVAADASNPEQEAGQLFSQTPKIVFSHTLDLSKWENTEVEKGDFVGRINGLKAQSGGDLIAYGGGKFVSSLIREKLIDELHLFVNPVILGKGMSIFREVVVPQKLNLAGSQQFECGISVLVYTLA